MSNRLEFTFANNRQKFAEKLKSTDYLISAELNPPMHYDLKEFMHSADIISQYVNVLQINDHLNSKPGVTNLVAGQNCKEAGMDPVLQFNLQNKNHIALQGELLGMAASGLENIIVLDRNHSKVNNDKRSINIKNSDTIEMVRRIRKLASHGQLFNGEIIDPPPSFTIGAVEFPCSFNQMESSISILEQKINAGCEFVQIQPVFELEMLYSWMMKVIERGLHQKARFISSVFPFCVLESMHLLKETPFLDIPDHLIKRIEYYNYEQDNLQLIIELIQGIGEIPEISGIHISSIGAEKWIPKIIEATGLGGELVY